MEPQETQSESVANTSYFDPDLPDTSEQEFAASLDIPVAKPSFVLDRGEVTSAEADVSRDFITASAPEDSPPRLPGGAELGSSPGQSPTSPSSPPLTTEADPDWRNQVSARVNHYKSRRAQKVRYPSLQLQFDTPAPRLGRTVEREGQDFLVEPSVPEESPALSPTVSPSVNVISLDSTARVIEFPRPTALPRYVDELAEPVVDRPRIVEAPAVVPPPPALGGIMIEAAKEQEPERRAGFDMPLQSAPLRRRLLAAGIDALFVGLGLVMFGYVLQRFNAPIQQPKLAVQIGALLTPILWFAYQYAFLIYTGSTPGVRCCRLTLNHFDGSPVTRRMRRWRVVASFLSCISLGLGYAWCFFDEDQLSWHDRITKTHLAPVASPTHK